MPEGKAKSKAQRRLMAQALQVRQGDMKLSDIDADYQDAVANIANGSMSNKDLEAFASGSEKGKPHHVKQETMANENLIKSLTKRIMTEAKGHEFKAKGNIIAIEGKEDKEEAKALAAEFLKFVKKDSSLKDIEDLHITISIGGGEYAEPDMGDEPAEDDAPAEMPADVEAAADSEDAADNDDSADEAGADDDAAADADGADDAGSDDEDDK